MKRIKLVSLILCAVFIMCTLSGCAAPKLPFFNKDEPEESSPVEQPMEDTRAVITASGVHNKDDVVVFTDIVTVDSSLSDSVVGMVIYVNNAEVTELPTSAPGQFSAIVAVEFADGSTWSGEYSYSVEDNGPQFPDDITNALSELDWEVINLTSETEGAIATVTTVTGVPVPVQIGDGMSFTSDSAHWEIMLLSNTEEEYLANNGVSPLRTSMTSIFVKSMIEFAGSMVEDEEPQEPQTEYDEAMQYMQWISQATDELISVTTSETDMLMYKADGSSVPVKVATVDYPAESGVAGVVQCFYVDYDSSSRILMTYVPAMSPTYIDVTNSDTDEERDEYPETYEEVKQEVLTGLLESLSTFNNPTSDANREMGLLCSRMIIGDASSLIPEKAPAEGEQSGESYATPEPTDNPEDELTGAIADARMTYAQRNPDLFTWPSNESGDEYSRWVYTIEEGTSFIGSIWLGREGRYFNSEEDILASQGGAGTGTAIGTGAGGEQGNQAASIITRYGTYLFSNASMPEVKIDYDKSTNNVIHLEYMNNKYYIESVSASTIQNYISSCIYSTSQFGSKDYSVDESRSTDTDKGKVTEYEIQYFDMTGSKKVAGYMVVYNINNDYLVIYADNLDNDTSKMQQMITKMLN